MPNYILEKKLIINGRRINCKVTGAPGSEQDGAPFILDIRGGPGQALATTLPDYFDQHPAGTPAPHWILYDALGCGESDPAEDPETEYTVDHFTEIAAGVVEAVADEFQVKKMNLRVVGGSFGGMIALDLPRIRPEWTQSDSPIRLQAIFPFIAPLGMKDCMRYEFLNSLYANDPHLPDYQKAMARLYAGDIKDRADFISHMVVPLASTYGKAYNSFFIKAALTLLKHYPFALYRILNILKHIKPFSVFAIRQFDWLYRFSFEVTNYFWKNQFHGYELEDKFKQDPALQEVYSKVLIFAVYGATDLCTSGENSLRRLQQLLPETGSFLHPGRHHDFVENYKIIMRAFLNGRLDLLDEALNNPLVKNAGELSIPVNFRERFAACYQAASSTADIFTNLGVHHDDKAIPVLSIKQDLASETDSEKTDKNKMTEAVAVSAENKSGLGLRH